MECEVCGKFYSVTHDCVGVAPRTSDREAAPVPTHFAPLYYLRLAISIMRWDDVSVRRAARDRRALLYGLFFSTVSGIVVFSSAVIPAAIGSMSQTGLSGAIAMVAGFIFGSAAVIVALVIAGTLALVQAFRSVSLTGPIVEVNNVALEAFTNVAVTRMLSA